MSVIGTSIVQLMFLFCSRFRSRYSPLFFSIILFGFCASKTRLNPSEVFLLTFPRWFLCCGSSLLVRRCFHMWRLFGIICSSSLLLLMSRESCASCLLHSLGISILLCFMFVAFPGYLHFTVLHVCCIPWVSPFYCASCLLHSLGISILLCFMFVAFPGYLHFTVLHVCCILWVSPFYCASCLLHSLGISILLCFMFVAFPGYLHFTVLHVCCILCFMFVAFPGYLHFTVLHVCGIPWVSPFYCASCLWHSLGISIYMCCTVSLNIKMTLLALYTYV